MGPGCMPHRLRSVEYDGRLTILVLLVVWDETLEARSVLVRLERLEQTDLADDIGSQSKQSQWRAAYRLRSASPCSLPMIRRSRYVVQPSFNQKWLQEAQPMLLPNHDC